VESRNAGTWLERPGQGLFQPATLAALRVQAFTVSGRLPGPGGWAFSAGATWRVVAATGGEVANLPRGQGGVGAAWTRGRITLGGTVDHVRGRPRGAAGGTALEPYTDLALSAGWRPLSWATLTLKASNLLGQTIERWAGYPEPRHLVTLAALAAF
jgi:hypothetical protein